MRVWVATALSLWWGLAVLSPVELLATLANAGLGVGLLVTLLGLGFTLVRRDRRGAVAYAGLVTLFGVTAGARVTGRARPVAHAADTGITVVTYNVLFRGGDEASTIAAIRAQDADVIFLQEITPDWVARVRGLGPHHTIAPHRGTHGLAVVARHPLTRARTWPNRDGRDIAQCVDVALPGGPVGMCHVHLASPSGALTQTRNPLDALAALERNAVRRRRQWTELEAAMQASHAPVVVAGDFNTLPSERLLVDARTRWVDAARERAGFRAASTWPRLAASAHRPPWPLNRLGAAGPWFRIDYVLVDPALGIAEAARVPGGGSDHFAVRATVTLP